MPLTAHWSSGAAFNEECLRPRTWPGQLRGEPIKCRSQADRIVTHCVSPLLTQPSLYKLYDLPPCAEEAFPTLANYLRDTYRHSLRVLWSAQCPPSHADLSRIMSDQDALIAQFVDVAGVQAQEVCECF